MPYNIETKLTPDVREILQDNYDRSNLQFLFKNILIPDFEYRNNSISHTCDIFGDITEIGGSKSLDLAVYEVNLDSKAYKKRVKITQCMFKVLREYGEEYSIVIFNTGDGKYRLSLLTCKYEYDPLTSKIINTLSNPRRFSFSLGVGAKTKTAYDVLIKKGKVSN
ncbi:MAG: hypothetical protein LBE09_01355, partial [Christensenellaceae bacterium]|nr:hypothetical protein [Christensenellaceae bacterium]